MNFEEKLKKDERCLPKGLNQVADGCAARGLVKSDGISIWVRGVIRAAIAPPPVWLPLEGQGKLPPGAAGDTTSVFCRTEDVAKVGNASPPYPDKCALRSDPMCAPCE